MIYGIKIIFVHVNIISLSDNSYAGANHIAYSEKYIHSKLENEICSSYFIFMNMSGYAQKEINKTLDYGTLYFDFFYNIVKYK